MSPLGTLDPRETTQLNGFPARLQQAPRTSVFNTPTLVTNHMHAREILINTLHYITLH